MSLFSRLKNTTENFTENSGIGGVPQTFHSKTWVQKIVWGGFFIAFLFFTIRDTVDVFKEYYHWPVVTRVQIESFGNVKFPAVSICNLNPIDCINLQKIKEENSI